MEIGSVIELEDNQYYCIPDKEEGFYLPFMKRGDKEWKTAFFQSGRNAIEELLLELFAKEKNKKILIPDYICDSVVGAVKRVGISYEKYKINRKFEIQIDELEQRLNPNIKCIYMAHYFGKQFEKKELDAIKNWKKQGIVIIEDITLSLFTEDIFGIGFGDYILGSIRKWLPIPDGGFLATQNESLPQQKMEMEISQYTYYYLLTQMMKREYIKDDCIDKKLKESYMTYYKKAMKDLFTDYRSRSITEFSKNYLNNYHMETIIQKRIQNYDYLYDRLKENQLVIPAVERQGRYVPLGMTVFCEKRDELLEFMIEHDVYCNIHWRLESNYENEDVNVLSKTIMTIPCDQRYGKKEMNYIINVIREWSKYYV